MVTLLLNQHPNVALGFERFKRARDILEPFHFEPEVLCSPVPAETDIFVPGFYEFLRRKLEHGRVGVIGDKVPMYTDSLEHLRTTFPGCRIVITVRELEATAASFRERARDPGDIWSAANDHLSAPHFWNQALQAAREFERAGHGEQLLLLPYDELFSGQRLWLGGLLEFLGLPATAAFERAYEEALHSAHERARSVQRELSGAEREELLAQRDEELDAWWRARIEAQRDARHARLQPNLTPPPQDEDDSSIPMAPETRNELLEALRAAPIPEPEMSELERRVAVQMRELAERGRRVSELESELETVRAQLAAAQAETAELRQARVAAEELDRRLAIRTEELNAVTRQLSAFEGSVRTLERALAELQSATEGLREERAGLVERVDTLALQNEGLVQTLAQRERSEQALALEVRRLHDAEARAGELEAHVERLERERAQTLSDVRRVAASRAWRLGHGATTLLRRATFRPVRTGGALDAIIDRLDVPKSPARLELPPGRQQLPAGPAEDASPDAS